MQATAKISSFVASFVFFTSCSTSTNAVTSSWCLAPKPFVRAFKAFPDVHIEQVSKHMIKSAYRMLSNRSIVNLDETTYGNLLDANAKSPNNLHLYLMRAGIMAPAGLSLSQLAQHARMSNFSSYEGTSSGTLHIVSLITSERLQQPTNIPVLVATPAAITEVSATCIGGR